MARDYIKDFKNHCLTCEKYDIYSRGDSTQRGYRCKRHMRPMAMDEQCSSYSLDKIRSNSTIEEAVNWRVRKGYSPSPDRSHWYVTTAICHILGYSDDCEYMKAFDEVQSTYMRDTDEGKDDLLKYEIFGPEVAWRLEEDYCSEENHRLVERLCREILEPDYLVLILGLIKAGNMECAVLAYKQMVDMLAQRYNVYMPDLQFDAEDREMFDSGDTRKRICFDCQECPSRA